QKPAGLTFNLTSTIKDDTPIKSAREIALEKAGLTHLLPPKPIGGEPSGASFPDQAEDRVNDELAGTAGIESDSNDQVTREDFRDSTNDMGTGSEMVQESAAREGSATDHEEISA